MGYSVALPGVGEAARAAIQALIVADLANLNAAVNRDDAVGPRLALTAAQIQLGDTDYLDGARISLVGGDDPEADMAVREEFTGAGYLLTVRTSLYLYIDPRPYAALAAGPPEQAAMQERVRQRVCDHLRARLFNTRANSQIALASRESGDAGDLLQGCHIARVWMGRAHKGFGRKTEVLAAHLTHVGHLAVMGG